jgi:hypothetical protein
MRTPITLQNIVRLSLYVVLFYLPSSTSTGGAERGMEVDLQSRANFKTTDPCHNAKP